LLHIHWARLASGFEKHYQNGYGVNSNLVVSLEFKAGFRASLIQGGLKLTLNLNSMKKPHVLTKEQDPAPRWTPWWLRLIGLLAIHWHNFHRNHTGKTRTWRTI